MHRESSQFDVIIVGGGVIGCAIACRLASSGLRVVLVEQESGLGTQASGRTSGILHSGIHLPPESLASQLCLEGASQVHDYCHRKGILHHRRGKLIVARSKGEIKELEAFAGVAHARGLKDVRLLTGSQIQDVEPNVSGLAGLHSSHETVVDPTSLVHVLAQDAKDGGVEFRTGVTVFNVEDSHQDVRAETTAGILRGRFLVNAAGISALRLAHKCGVARRVSLLPLQGVYYHATPNLVNGVVHPVPNSEYPFLKVHIERLAGGRVRIGPRAHPAGWGLLLHRSLYRLALRPYFCAMAFDQILGGLTMEAYVKRVRQVVPTIRAEELMLEQAATNPQLVARGKMLNDFVIAEGQRSIHLLNIRSPGFTCCLALADHVVIRMGL